MKICLVHSIIEINFLYESEYLDFFSSYVVEEGNVDYVIYQEPYSEDSDKGDLKITSKNYHLYVKDNVETQYQFLHGDENNYEGKIVYGKNKFSFSLKDPHDVHLGIILLQYIATRILSEAYPCILMEGTAFSINGKGILITGSYLDGRLSLSDLYLKNGAVVINTIRNYLVKEEDGVMIYGNPWSNEETKDNNNVIAPLTHIFSLVEGDDLYLKRLEVRDAFLKLMSEIVTPQTDERSKWEETIDEVVKIPCFLMIGKDIKKLFLQIEKAIEQN